MTVGRSEGEFVGPAAHGAADGTDMRPFARIVPVTSHPPRIRLSRPGSAARRIEAAVIEAAPIEATLCRRANSARQQLAGRLAAVRGRFDGVGRLGLDLVVNFGEVPAVDGEVFFHGAGGLVGIAGADRIEDALVMLPGNGGPEPPQGLEPAFGQQIVDGSEDEREKGIAGRLGQRRMEVAVGLHMGRERLARLVQNLLQPFEFAQVFGAAMLGGERGDRGLEGDPHGGEVGQPLGNFPQQPFVPQRDLASVGRGDACSRTLTAFDQPKAGETPERFADDRPADLELAAEQPFGRQPLSGEVFSLDNGLLQLAADVGNPVESVRRDSARGGSRPGNDDRGGTRGGPSWPRDTTMVDVMSTEENRAHAQGLTDAAHRLSVLLDLPHGIFELRDWSDQLQARPRELRGPDHRFVPCWLFRGSFRCHTLSTASTL